MLRDHGPLHEHRPQQELHFDRDQARGLRNKVARLPWWADDQHSLSLRSSISWENIIFRWNRILQELGLSRRTTKPRLQEDHSFEKRWYKNQHSLLKWRKGQTTPFKKKDKMKKTTQKSSLLKEMQRRSTPRDIFYIQTLPDEAPSLPWLKIGLKFPVIFIQFCE